MDPKPTMLVVDDSADIRILLRALGKREGFSVTLASSGTEAIEILSSREFDLVLLDLMLPRVNGLDVLAYYQRRYPGERNVIIITAAGESLRRQINPDAVLGVMSKPFDVEQLTDLFRSRLEIQPGAGRVAGLALPAIPYIH